MDVNRLFVTPDFHPALRVNMSRTITHLEEQLGTRFSPLLAVVIEVPKEKAPLLRKEYELAAKADKIPACVMISTFTFPDYRPRNSFVSVLFPLDVSTFVLLSQMGWSEVETTLTAIHSNWVRVYQSPLLNALGSVEN
jgi:hypothetical protein